MTESVLHQLSTAGSLMHNLRVLQDGPAVQRATNSSKGLKKGSNFRLIVAAHVDFDA